MPETIFTTTDMPETTLPSTSSPTATSTTTVSSTSTSTITVTTSTSNTTVTTSTSTTSSTPATSTTKSTPSTTKTTVPSRKRRSVEVVVPTVMSPEQPAMNETSIPICVLGILLFMSGIVTNFLLFRAVKTDREGLIMLWLVWTALLGVFVVINCVESVYKTKAFIGGWLSCPRSTTCRAMWTRAATRSSGTWTSPATLSSCLVEAIRFCDSNFL